MSPWKAALPALIIGPVTYLVCVAVLAWRKTTPQQSVEQPQQAFPNWPGPQHYANAHRVMPLDSQAADIRATF